VKPVIKIFPDNPQVARSFANEFVTKLQFLSTAQDVITVSLSGGSTPKLLFQVLAEEHAESVDWTKIHFFWGDERCVAPDDADSNYGEAYRLLLSKIHIPSTNIHRVLGENEPAIEAERYEREISGVLTHNGNDIPSFDIMILGMGADGHTASIFPHQISFLESERICEVATHPESGQKRITITGKIINASASVYFLITGESKAPILAEIMQESGRYRDYPTSHIAPAGELFLFVDQSAAAQLD
jgi:6-phosphogluconolactonase